MSTRVIGMILGLAALAVAQAASAADQRLELRAGWNLVGFAVPPVDPSPAAVLAPLQSAGVLEALWAYDAASQTWSTYPAPAGVRAITAVDTAHGYWLKVKSNTSLDVTGDPERLPDAPNGLEAGWNLVAFPIAQPLAFDIPAGDPAIREIWTFDAAAAQPGFRAVRKDPVSGAPTRVDFNQIQPGRGYWIQAGQDVSLAPELITLLPPDVDLSPFVAGAMVDKAVPFTKSAGDVDIGGDGLYDRPRTQRVVSFGQNLERQKMAIYNGNAGLLAWRARLSGWRSAQTGAAVAPFVYFETGDTIEGTVGLAEEVSGTSFAETTMLRLVSDRTGLPPGAYEADLHVDSNATTEGLSSERTRYIRVLLAVGDFDGLYALTTRIESVADKRANLASLGGLMALYRDRGGLTGIVDSELSLLVPHRLRLTGGVYQSGTSRMELSGSIILPEDDPDNPYGKPIRRDITLRGARRTPGNPDDSAMAPLDLRGEYYETIHGALPIPIRLAGTFLARQVSAEPKLADETGTVPGGAQGIPDGTGQIDSTRVVAVPQTITEVDVTVNLEHARPTDLKVSLIHPDGTMVALRDHSPGFTGEAQYDDRVDPVQSLVAFAGKRSQGTWKLRVVDDVTGIAGTLKGWSLRIRGTRVHSVSGIIGEVGDGALVQLTGCGVSRIGTTGPGGAFSFDDLVDCPYQITVLEPGWNAASVPILLDEVDVTGVSIVPVRDPNYVEPPVLEWPFDPIFGFTLRPATTLGAAGVHFAGRPAPDPVAPLPLAKQYYADAATYDVDHVPYVQGGCPTDEDINAFGDACDDVTKSRVLEDATCKIDGPGKCENDFRAVMTIGLPVIGHAVAGDTQMFIGGQP